MLLKSDAFKIIQAPISNYNNDKCLLRLNQQKITSYLENTIPNYKYCEITLRRGVLKWAPKIHNITIEHVIIS